jgi:hypothetical protein
MQYISKKSPIKETELKQMLLWNNYSDHIQFSTETENSSCIMSCLIFQNFVLNCEIIMPILSELQSPKYSYIFFLNAYRISLATAYVMKFTNNNNNNVFS